MSEEPTGKWLRTGTTVYCLERARGWRSQKELRNRWSAQLTGGPDTPPEELEAVARKMEAAADLLAACQMAVDEARERDEDMGYNCWPVLLAAIAKAVDKNVKAEEGQP